MLKWQLELLCPFDPIQLTFNVLNNLMKKGIISYDDARDILKQSLDPNMKDEDKEKLLDSFIKRV